MKLYRFSPILTPELTLETITYLHKTCHQLCLETVGKYLPVSGNVGVFCHDYEEYNVLAKIRQELTYEAPNYNGKYFQLKTPIVIAPQGDIPGATYDFLYIRKVDPYRYQVGDVDFMMSPEEHADLKATLHVDEFSNGARIFGRAEDNMIELWKPEKDVISYVVVGSMRDKIIP
jgi:hypothetical protein